MSVEGFTLSFRIFLNNIPDCVGARIFFDIPFIFAGLMTQPIVFGLPFLLFSWFFYRSLANTDVYEIKVWIFFGDGRSQRIEVVRGLQWQVVGKFVTPGIKLFINRLVRHRNQIIYSHIFRTPIYATVFKYRSKINFAQKCRDSLFSKTWHLFLPPRLVDFHTLKLNQVCTYFIQKRGSNGGSEFRPIQLEVREG